MRGLQNQDRFVFNLDLLNQAEARQDSPDQLNAMKMIFKIPDDNFLKTTYAQSYPVWLIEERLNEEDRKKNFKIVELWYGDFFDLPKHMKYLHSKGLAQASMKR
jgi:hypothetical protein